MTLTDVSDEELVSHLEAICVEGHQRVARLIEHLIEVEERRLHVRSACRSLFDFCLRRLGMSEGAAFRRINAARLVRRFPSLLPRIERGEIHLSALVLLRDHLTEATVDELVAAASGLSTREVEALLARLFPQPDVPASIRKLPGTRGVGNASAEAASAEETTLPLPGSGSGSGSGSAAGARPAAGVPVGMAGVAARGAHGHAARIEPLSEDRYRVQLTASVELREKLERARDLMRHRNPSGDLAVVVERALDALLENLERERLGATIRPRRTARPPMPGYVTRAVRREVLERDGEQCTYVDGAGRRCCRG